LELAWNTFGSRWSTFDHMARVCVPTYSVTLTTTTSFTSFTSTDLLPSALQVPSSPTLNATRFAHLRQPMPQVYAASRASLQCLTRRARHLASWALARDHVLSDWGFTVYRNIQDSFVRSLSFFRLELPLCLFFLPFRPSHRTRDDASPFTHNIVAHLYITTLADLGQWGDQSRTLSMQ